jgi:hypothetical protein
MLAISVDILHIAYIGFILAGFGIPAAKYPDLANIHRITVFCGFAFQAMMSFRCPLSLLSLYLRALANGKEPATFFDGFVVRLMKNMFGFGVPEIIITVVGAILALIALILFIAYK